MRLDIGDLTNFPVGFITALNRAESKLKLNDISHVYIGDGYNTVRDIGGEWLESYKPFVRERLSKYNPAAKVQGSCYCTDNQESLGCHMTYYKPGPSEAITRDHHKSLIHSTNFSCPI